MRKCRNQTMLGTSKVSCHRIKYNSHKIRWTSQVVREQGTNATEFNTGDSPIITRNLKNKEN
jgi:hypothetical protein